MLTTIMFASPVRSVDIYTLKFSSPGNASSFHRLSSLFLLLSPALTFRSKTALSVGQIYQQSSLTLDMYTCIIPFYPFLSPGTLLKISNRMPQMYLRSTPYSNPQLSDLLICYIQNPPEIFMPFICPFHHNLRFHTYIPYC